MEDAGVPLLPELVVVPHHPEAAAPRPVVGAGLGKAGVGPPDVEEDLQSRRGVGPRQEGGGILHRLQAVIAHVKNESSVPRLSIIYRLYCVCTPALNTVHCCIFLSVYDSFNHCIFHVKLQILHVFPRKSRIMITLCTFC